MSNRYLRGNKKNKNTSYSNNTNNKATVNKASFSYESRRMRKGVVGSQGLAYYESIVDRLRPFELKFPQCLKTFERMKLDDAVGAVLQINYVLIESAFKNYKIKPRADSERSKQLADFIRYQLENMRDTTFFQAIKNIETFKEKGFSIVEKVYEKPSQPYQISGIDVKYDLVALANRPQLSLKGDRPFTYTDGGRKIAAVYQDLNSFYNLDRFGAYVPTENYTIDNGVEIIRPKFMLFGDNATDATPFGNPLLRSCWKAWKEKVLLEDLEVNGASKDLSGIIKITCPEDIIRKANADPNSDEAIMIEGLMDDAAALHNGSQPFIFLPSDIQKTSTSTKAYDFSLTGLDGGSKAYNTSDLIKARRKAIFDTFGAGALLLGEGSSGSYNLAESKNAIHAHYIKRDISIIEDVINHDLIPQMLLLNDIEFDVLDLPKIKAGPIEKLAADDIGKLIQRFMSVNGLVMTKENIIAYHEMAGFDVDHLENMSQEELLQKMNSEKGTSRSGEGMGTSGTGNSQVAFGGDSNIDNKSKFAIKLDKNGFYWDNNSDKKTYLTKEEKVLFGVDDG